MLKVWIVGSEGQIGEAINEVLDPLEIEVLNTDKNALDITETDEVLHFGEINRPDVIINCTGITDTDECEKNPDHQLCCDHRRRALREAAGGSISCKRFRRPQLKPCGKKNRGKDGAAFHRRRF